MSPTGRDLTALTGLRRPAAAAPAPAGPAEVGTPTATRRQRKPKAAKPDTVDDGTKRTTTVYLAAKLKEDVVAAAAAAKSTVAEWVLDQLDQHDTPGQGGKRTLDDAFAGQQTTRTSGLPARTRQARPRSTAGSSLQLKLTAAERRYIEQRVEETGAVSSSAFLARVCELGITQQR